MKKTILLILSLLILSFVLLIPNPVSSFEVQDCDVMKKDNTKIGLGFKAGTFFFGVGPELNYHKSFGTTWSDNAQYFVAEYQELCSRYNTGRISKEQYDTEIQNIIQRSRMYSVEMYKHFQTKKNNLFEELEREIFSNEEFYYDN